MGTGFRTATSGGIAAPPYTNGPYTFSEDITFEGDVVVQGNLTFGNVSTDDLTINGHISTDDAHTTKFIETGTYQSTASGGITLSATNLRPTAFLHDDAGAALGAGDYRAVLSRTLLTLDQPNAITLNSMRAQIKMLDGIDISNTSSVVSPMTSYLELAGTGARTLSGHVACHRAAIEEGASGTTTVAASSFYSGFEATLNSTRTYTVTGDMAAFMCNISGGTSVWPVGALLQSCTIGLKLNSAATQRAIDIQITPTTADRQLYMDIDYGSNSKEAAYIISSSAKTSGETTAGRFRGQGKAASSSTAEIRGVHAQGIAFEALYSGTVNAIYAEAIAKGTSTVTTMRGIMCAVDSENTPTSITNMYGCHVRMKTSVAPATDYIAHLVESEKFGSGVALDSFMRFKTTTWTGGETVATDVISMASLTGTVTNIIDYSGPTCTSVLYSSNTATNFLEVSADSKGGAGATRATPNQTATCDGSLVVKVGSKTLLAPLYNAVTIA